MASQAEQTILLINDDPDSLGLMSHILRKANYRILMAENGLEGLDTAQIEHPDLIISDVMMPVMDGIEFCRQARQISHLKTTPIILVSAFYKGSERVIAGLDAGADSYIEVPYEPMHLVAKVSRLLERREIEAEYDRFFNFSLDLLCITDNYGNFVKTNPAWKKTLGYTSQELTSRSIVDFVHPEDGEKLLYYIHDGDSDPFEIRFLSKNGTYKWLLWTFTHIREKKLIYAVVHDITGRKANEESLRKSKEEATNILESIADGFIALDKDWNFTYVNQAAEIILNRPKEILLGKTLWDEFPDVRGTFDVMYMRAVEEQVPVRFTDYYPAPLDKWFEVQAFPAKSGLSIYFRDVTERRKAIDNVVRSEAQFKAVFSSSLDGMVIVDNEGKCLNANDSACVLFGLAEEEMLGTDIKNYLSTEDNVSFSGEWQDFLNHKIQNSEYILTRADGKRLNVSFASPNTFLPGKYLIVLRDITQRKAIEENLIQSQKQLAEAQSLVHLVSCVWKAQTGVIWSDEVYNILGVDPETFKVSLFSMRNLAHPDDRAYFYSQFARKFYDGEEIEFRHRAILPDQSIKTLRQRLKVSVNDKGIPVSYLGTVQDITESKQKEDALRQAEARYRTLVESLPGIVYLVQPQTPYSLLYVSPNINILGFSPEDWHDQPDLWKRMIHDEDREHVIQSIKDSIEYGTDTEFEYRINTTYGATRWLQNKGRLILDENGNKIGWQGLMLDVTETKRLEAQLGQSQRLESIGRLAGGIAHDFNNMLMTINGYCELSLRMIEDDELLRSNIEEIKKASERSALLTHQLLAFSRQQVLQLKVLDLNEVIDDISRMIERLLGERIELNIIQEPHLKNVKADLGQLTQIIMNLAVNARDAMPDGGGLTIQTSNVYLDEDFAAQHQPTQPGNYVLLKIQDTGTGIDEETLKYIFEPFYTTKELGKGVGLGLATVYGIIKQSGGYIWVDSKLGEGTTFNVYMPQILEEPDEMPIEDMAPGYELDGSETILLAEDEDMVRALTSQILEEYGYTVIEARDGVEALDLYKNRNRNIDLLMTDVVMPHMDGRELAEHILKDDPQIHVLFTSGYTDDEVIRHKVIATNTNFIQKPFTFDELAYKIREILSAKDEGLVN